MVLDDNIIKKFNEHIGHLDSMYDLYLNEPNELNYTRHKQSAEAFTRFCVNTMINLVEQSNRSSKKSQIPFEDYLTCKTCGAALLVSTEGGYIGSSDFMEEYPGWCLPCILEFIDTHCKTEGSCKTCSVHTDSEACIFKDRIAGLREMLSDDFDLIDKER